MKINYQLMVLLVFAFISCGKDDNSQVSPGTYDKGIFVLNQGKFPGGASAITFISDNGVVTNDVYAAENSGDQLGPVAQGLFFKGENAYISINNGNEVVIMDAKTLKFKTALTETEYPRYFVAQGDKVLMSEWGKFGFDGSIKIIDSSLKVTGEIKTGRAPEKMLVVGNKLYVTMSNGFQKDSTLTIYDLANNTKINELKLGLGPNSLVKDAAGNIWVLCGGYIDYLTFEITDAALYKISGDAVVSFIPLEGSDADNLVANAAGTKLFFQHKNKVIELNPTSLDSKEYSIDGVSGNLYGLAYDEVNNAIYVSDPKDFGSKGAIYKINLNNLTINEYESSIVPAQIVVRR